MTIDIKCYTIVYLWSLMAAVFFIAFHLCGLCTHNDTNLNCMTMPYLGRVPSPGWKRACNIICHPGMCKVGWGMGYNGLSLSYIMMKKKMISCLVHHTG